MNTRSDNLNDPSKTTRVNEAITTLIEDLKSSGQLSDEELKAVAGGIEVTCTCTTTNNVVHMRSYQPNSSTADNDYDYGAASD